MKKIEGERPPQDPTTLAREQLYIQELPAALKIQQGLFEDLRAIGVIDMIDKMIEPDKILPIEMPKKPQVSRETPKQSKPGITTYMDQEKVNRLWFGTLNQKWQGGIFNPRQREDGSLDPTLRIWINNDTTSFGLYREEYMIPLKTVMVSYSSEKVLMIEGAKTTFKDVVTIENADKWTIAFQQALQHPMAQHLPSSRPSDAEMSAHCNF
ncbi:MAG: hypothetical protein Q7R31_02075 [Candidatus Levybacteria bacterium]|nr:hypothetical protein [Candidatus Levybacteria bacterium]